MCISFNKAFTINHNDKITFSMVLSTTNIFPILKFIPRFCLNAFGNCKMKLLLIPHPLYKYYY